MRKLIPALALILIVILAAAAQISLAESTVQIFFVACENQAVVNLTGSMDAGDDVYFQVFSGAGGTGTALSSLRQARVDGTFAFSETIAYNGATVPAGGIASLKVVIAREGSPTRTSYETTVDDVNDGCNNPQNPVASSVDLGGAGTTSGAAVSGSSAQILSPLGGFLNPPLPATPQPIVVIGPRRSTSLGRAGTPGVVFAECNQYLPRAEPGLLYDTDPILIFWSWWAKTPELVQDHIAAAKYAVTLNGVAMDYAIGPIEKRTQNYWVFYTARVGALAPGLYRVDFNQNWDRKISDGFASYGPGTDHPQTLSNCNFRIEPNPSGSDPRQYSPIFLPE